MMASTFNSKTEERNWLELPSDVTANILKRISMIDILENAENVCTTWRKICTDDPTMWTVIDTSYLLNSTTFKFNRWIQDFSLDLDSVSFIPTEKWFKRLIDRSQGQLVDITLHDVILNHALLLYVADRSSQLRRLALSHGVYNIGSLTKALMKFPILEELSLYSVEVSKEVIESAGRYCPMLKTLKVNYKICGRVFRLTDERSLMRYNEVAIAIGENLRELRHLEIISYDMTNIGLEAILDGCRHLETLDLSWCDYIDLSGDLGKRCSKQFKVLKLTQETLDYDVDSEDEDDHYRDSPDS